MHDRIPFHLELAGESATMYVHGRLDHASCATMAEVCDSLPQEVRALRVDLRAIGAMTDEVAAAVRLLLTRWRDGRRGEFRLTASHLTAVSRPVAVAPPFGSGPAEYVRDPMALAPL
jgi:hypothetical protein